MRCSLPKDDKISGDGDFRSLVEAIQGRGLRHCSLDNYQPAADDLRHRADVLIDLVELKSKIGRDLSESPGPASRAI